MSEDCVLSIDEILNRVEEAIGMSPGGCSGWIERAPAEEVVNWLKYNIRERILNARSNALEMNSALERLCDEIDASAYEKDGFICLEGDASEVRSAVEKAKDVLCISRKTLPRVPGGECCRKSGDTLDDFYVIDMGEGMKSATRSRTRISGGERHPPLTRRDLYRGRMDKAEREYAHSFMCSGFPIGNDPNRPSKDEWLDKKPFDFEVDEFVSEKLFGERNYNGR